ncbi:hypothetical protein [Enterococcus durans]|uniref:Uncharacterized protein n=4 Tax=Enterococcus durans TaxID=53345 RepID=A0A377KIR6_9ENTE|nr:hypothetical protein [Enterococcus durans]STP28823.1 Uncharacterised protein [Enterococcus durans]
MSIYDLFRERKQAKLLRLVTRKRQRYLNSEEYVKNMCSTIIQNLNLMGNPIQEKMKKVPNAVIELMPIYQQMLDLHSDKFPDRNIPLLKESFQKSLYSSVETKLLPFYLNDLKEDHPDSFLLLPINVCMKLQNGEDGYHGMDVIIRKVRGDFEVATYDKAQIRIISPDSQSIQKKLRAAVYIDDQKKQITPIYIYKIKNSPQKVKAITQALRIGRLHLNWFERNELIKGPFEEYRPLHLFSRCAKKEYYSNDLATSQYVQDNCMVNNLNGAMKYILGVKKQVKIKNQIFYKSSIPNLSNGDFKKELTELAIVHLKNSGASGKTLKILQQALVTYLDEKGKRTEVPQQEKISYKLKKGKETHRAWLQKTLRSQDLKIKQPR